MNRNCSSCFISLAVFVLSFASFALPGCSSENPAAASQSGGSAGRAAGGGGGTSGSGGATSGGAAGASAGGSSGSGGTSSGDASIEDDASTGSGGAADTDASLGSGGGGTGGFDRDAGYGCGDAGIPDFCDNGVRIKPPTGNPTIDALLNLTPVTCAKRALKPGSTTAVQHSYKMDLDSKDLDSLAGLKSDICVLNGAVYWVADMDIDCDGHTTPGKCDKDHDCCYLQDTNVHGPNGALTSSEDPYVVIPIDFGCPGEPTFPDYPGIKAGTVVAVIYGKKIYYGVFGDCGPPEIIGEASYSMAERLGIPPSALNGGVLGQTVTYIVFTGNATVPKNITDEVEVQNLGADLTNQLLQANK
jgi:hypothetical protein